MNRNTRTAALLVSAGLVLAPAAAGPIVSLYSRHPEPNGQFGISVTTLQTIDPTVYHVAVGAPREQVGTYDLAGRVVIFDHAGAVVRTLVSPNKQTAGFFGYCVASVPDVNGDAISDLAVGAPNEVNEGNEFSGRGRVYIFNSVTGALVRTLSSPVNEVGGWFGKSVCGIGDVTGDARGDVAVGAPYEDLGDQPANSGRAYIFNGVTGALHRSMASPNQASIGEFGSTVASVPDCTGDGKPEILIAARGENVQWGDNLLQHAGRVYLVNAVNGNKIGSLTSPAPVADGAFGESVAGIADVNGDNKGDILVGSPREVVAGKIDSGRVHLYSGWNRAKIRSFAIGVPEGAELFGTAVSAMPDVNADGKQDVVIGAPRATPMDGLLGAGRVFIYSGATGAFVRAMQSPNQAEFGWFGGAVAGIVDSDNNSRGEVIVGAMAENTSIQVSGRAYLIRN